MIVKFTEKSELVEATTAIAQEELWNFDMGLQHILDRVWVLGSERKDEYVRDLQNFFPKGGSRMDQLIHELFYASIIKARGCKRLKLLSDSNSDKQLQKFYKKLMIIEAHHYSLFLKFARNYLKNKKEVNQKW